ncbi:conserved hypothetical protein [Paenibacillus curdlanolyticus YK9]|uniref:Uncharacterized protein n=1 Tax=Paenibacillus curdlanolyticus YK9 TaxID=717606 RepID=E0I6A6_9BACL|nr:hypothetical protein [Paenibacillus curdlanolyticus]EFM11572.1 conserved hypothetical protein [Paenibacillus curdlanolyticus YK9]
MEWVIGLLAIAGAVLIGWIHGMSRLAARLADGAAAVSLVVASSVLGAATFRTIRNDTVFMTEIHSILLSPAMLICTAYLTLHWIARLGTPAFISRNTNKPES